MLIYIAEDNEFFAETVSVGLTQIGHDVHIFHTGEKLINTIEINKPDLIILDFQFESPEEKLLNGGQILDLVQAKDKSIPVIMLSSLTDIDLSVSLLKKGVIDYIVKDDEFWSKLNNTIDNVIAVKSIMIEKTKNMKRRKQLLIRLAVSAAFVGLILIILYLIYIK
jgi:two-component system response regulator AtoC